MMIKGETKNIKIFTRDVFISDRNVAEFELEKLQKCSIANAIRILYYKRKYNDDFFQLHYQNIFSNSEKYIQRIKINDHWKKCILIESAFAEYFYQNNLVDYGENWMYVGLHETSFYRIIVGCGKGIILSRFISEDIFREVTNTKRYLQRLKIDSVKMFSNIDDFSDADKIDLDDVFKFIDKKNSIRPLFEKNHSLLIAMLYTIICFLLFWIAITINQCSSYDFSQFKLFSKVNGKNISIINSTNKFNQISDCLEKMQQLQFSKISNICKKYNLNVRSISINKYEAKITITATKKQLQNLQKTFQIMPSKNSEESTICLKLK